MELGGRYLCKVIDKGRSAGCSAWPANLVATSHCQGWVYKYQAGGRQRTWDRWKLRRLCFKVIHTIPDPYQVVVAGSLFWTVLTYRGCKPPLLGKSSFHHSILKCCFCATWDFFWSLLEVNSWWRVGKNWVMGAAARSPFSTWYQLLHYYSWSFAPGTWH